MLWVGCGLSEWVGTDLYSKTLFLDADCIALRKTDHLPL